MTFAPRGDCPASGDRADAFDWRARRVDEPAADLQLVIENDRLDRAVEPKREPCLVTMHRARFATASSPAAGTRARTASRLTKDSDCKPDRPRSYRATSRA